jgi:hypothetical protein
MRKNRPPTFLNLVLSLTAILSAAPCIAQAQEWAQVRGGAFDVAPAVISSVKETLHDYVALKLSKPGDWGAFLLQYRSVYVQGHRALEIHGSCGFADPGFKVHSEFYDESVMDGGDCYFLVYYDVKSKRYSNVVFHGLG